MKKTALFLFAFLLSIAGNSQTTNLDSTVQAVKVKKDSTLHALIYEDSVKVEKEFGDKIKKAKFLSVAIYPILKGGENSGVIPVKDPAEIPDPALDYKLLFEFTASNPDSLVKEINDGLGEVARVINLHVASGVPLKKIFPVIVVHGPALNAISTNDYYKEHFKTDNPNIKLINDLTAIGVKFIACGQAMAFLDMKKEALLPVVKVSITAQTVLTSYQLKGYVLNKLQ